MVVSWTGKLDFGVLDVVGLAQPAHTTSAAIRESFMRRICIGARGPSGNYACESCESCESLRARENPPRAWAFPVFVVNNKHNNRPGTVMAFEPAGRFAQLFA